MYQPIFIQEVLLQSPGKILEWSLDGLIWEYSRKSSRKFIASVWADSDDICIMQLLQNWKGHALKFGEE